MPSLSQPSRIEILTYPLTHNPIKVALLLEFLATKTSTGPAELPVDCRTIHLDKLEHHSEAFTQLNPNQKVPVLIDGNTILWESNAILHHLCNRFDSELWPKNPEQQSQVIRWLMWEASRWNHCIGSLLKNHVYFPFWGYEGSQTVIDKQSARLAALLDVLDFELQQQPYLAGDSLSIADIAIAAPLIYAPDLRVNLDDHNAVKLWLHELSRTTWWQQSQKNLDSFRAY